MPPTLGLLLPAKWPSLFSSPPTSPLLPRPAPPVKGGLSKLEQAATEVDALQKELSQARVVVKAATEECDQLLEVRRGGRGKGACDL